MFKILYILLLIPFFAIGNSSFYTIKLAVYKDFSGLQENISRLAPSLQKNIQIRHVGNLYKASTFSTKDRFSLHKILPSYRRVFADAFITVAKPSSTVSSSPVSVSAVPKVKNTFSKAPQRKSLSFHDRIQQHTLYLCSQRRKKKTYPFLIEVSFRTNVVTYNPIIGQVPPMSALYKTSGNKLYLYRKNLFNRDVYSVLEGINPKYYLISSWIKNKKINTLRYYFNLRDAKMYLNGGA